MHQAGRLPYVQPALRTYLAGTRPTLRGRDDRGTLLLMSLLTASREVRAIARGAQDAASCETAH